MVKPNSALVELAIGFATVLIALTAGTTVNWLLGVDASTAFTVGLIGGAVSLAVYFVLRNALAKGGRR